MTLPVNSDGGYQTYLGEDSSEDSITNEKVLLSKGLFALQDEICDLQVKLDESGSLKARRLAKLELDPDLTPFKTFGPNSTVIGLESWERLVAIVDGFRDRILDYLEQTDEPSLCLFPFVSGVFKPIEFYRDGRVFVHLESDDRIKALGKGCFSAPTISVDYLDERLLAHKQLLYDGDEAVQVRRARGEKKATQALGRLDHSVQLVALRELKQSNVCRLSILMEWMRNGTLKSYLEEGRENLTPETRMAIARMLLEALVEIEKAGYSHNDIKAENLFPVLDGSGKLRGIKVGDFGCARKLSRFVCGEHNNYIESPEWARMSIALMKEEQRLKCARVGKVKARARLESFEKEIVKDLWVGGENTAAYQAGLILYQLFVGDLPESILCNAGTYLKDARDRLNAQIKLHNELSEDLPAVVIRLLDPDPSIRPTVCDALQLLSRKKKPNHKLG